MSGPEKPIYLAIDLGDGAVLMQRKCQLTACDSPMNEYERAIVQLYTERDELRDSIANDPVRIALESSYRISERENVALRAKLAFEQAQHEAWEQEHLKQSGELSRQIRELESRLAASDAD